MIDHLRKIFSSAICYHDTSKNDLNRYEWFRTAENGLIGIAKSELTVKDVKLLSTFLEPHNLSFPAMTPQEEKWQTAIRTDYPSHYESVTAYRFIFFSFPPQQMEPLAFKEAVNEFFAGDVPILWENEHEGIIIEENPKEYISYETIIDVFMHDLSVKIRFFVGPFLYAMSHAKQGYQALVPQAAVMKHTDKRVMTYIDAIPYLLISEADTETKTNLIQTVLRDTAEDDDLLKTIETFLACNLNVSVTAKELYMHRNSLQYRLDKFTAQTGIDIRQFQQAVTVYLALLTWK